MRAAALPWAHFGNLTVNGLPTLGERSLFGFPVTIDVGRFSFGSLRESENAPLAERCLPTLGLRMSTS